MKKIQQTIQHPIQFRGKGLHSGKEAILRLLPGEPNTGIRFVRTDRPGSPSVSVEVNAVREIQRRTALVHGKAEVHTVEHLLATLYACSLTNLIIEIHGEEVPGLDGSSLEFYEGLKRVGFMEQSFEIPEFVLREPLKVEEKKGISLEAFPFSEGLKLTYHLHYDHPLLQNQQYTVQITEDSFAKEIAPARTFVLEEEVELLQKAGLGKGATYQNTLVIGEKGAIENEMRFENECVRHKILDLLGDISLLNINLRAHIVARRSGHQTNLKLALRIQETMQEFLNLR